MSCGFHKLWGILVSPAAPMCLESSPLPSVSCWEEEKWKWRAGVIAYVGTWIPILNPCKKLVMLVHSCNFNDEEVEAGTSLGLACQSSWQYGELYVEYKTRSQNMMPTSVQERTKQQSLISAWIYSCMCTHRNDAKILEGSFPSRQVTRLGK